MIELIQNYTAGKVNDAMYGILLDELISHAGDRNDVSPTGSRVLSEALGRAALFKPDVHIYGTNEKYVQDELDWYLSQDLSIAGHKGIGSNKIWKACAAEDGHVNSNYGWCIFSEENGSQYSHAMEELYKNPYTRQAVMIYTRPSIHKEKYDGLHARYDMICTMYTQLLVRNNVLYMHVHMRSNDVWNGLRNDLAWQQWVYSQAYEGLRGLFMPYLKKGHILWFADSLHLYERNLEQAKEWLSDWNMRTVKDD